MKFKLHYTIKGIEDLLVIEENSIEKCQTQVQKEIEKRGIKNFWSEEIRS